MAAVKLYQPTSLVSKEPPLRLLKQRVSSTRSIGATSSSRLSGPPVEIINDMEERGREHLHAIRTQPVDLEHHRDRGDARHQHQHIQPQPPQYARTDDNSPVRKGSEHAPQDFSLPDVNNRRRAFGQGQQQTPQPQQERQVYERPSSSGRAARAQRPARDLPAPRMLSFAEVPTNRLEIGLENLGNTCFMNSTLQCLLHIEPLVSYFLQGRMEAEINQASPKRGMIATSFHHLIQDIYNGGGSAVAPVNFQRVVSMYAPYLMDFQQQDSQEFLRFLLDGMSEDLCRRTLPQVSRTPKSPILPSLPHVEKVGSPPEAVMSSSASVGATGSTSRMSSIQRIRTETRAMRGQETTPERRGNNQEEEEEVVVDAGHATFPGVSHSHNKVRAAHDVAQARLQSGSLGAAEDEDITPPSPRAGDSSASNTSAVAKGATFSSQLRDVMTGRTSLRLRRSRPSSRNDEPVEEAEIKPGAAPEGTSMVGPCTADSAVEMEAAQAWERYLKLNESVITDIFGGLLQSTIQCMTCMHKSHSFDPFLDISVPIFREGETSSRSLFGSIRTNATPPESNKSTLEKCLAKFTAEEVLDGDNSYHCEKCKKKRKSIKQLMIYRYPKVLVIHIKRFRFNSTSREKLATDVHFPLAGLDLSPYVRRIIGVPPAADTNASSSAAAAVPQGATHWENCHALRRAAPLPVYDLVGVSNHHGSLSGGHYIAHVDTSSGGGQQKWVCFNDARVSIANASSIAGPTAYVLFYRLREGAPSATTATGTGTG